MQGTFGEEVRLGPLVPMFITSFDGWGRLRSPKAVRALSSTP